MKLLVLWLAFLAALNVSAQTIPAAPLRPLTIGDTVPDIEFTNLINYPSPTARLSDFRGKLVILDFWATWCGPCVAALPKLQKLQEQFGENIQIVAVTNESKGRVQAFLDKHKAAKNISSLILVSDTVLAKHFPHNSIPHEVWIHQDVVKAITTDEYVTEENIAAVLGNENISWAIKDPIQNYDYAAPIFNNLAASQNNSNSEIYYSGITGYIEGANSGSWLQKDSARGTLRYNQYNFPLLSLYAIAFNKFSVFDNPKRCQLNVSDVSKFIHDKHSIYMDQWTRNNYYSYEAYVAEGYSDSLLKVRLRSDLDFYFNLNSRAEKQQRECLILRVINRGLIPSTKNEIPTYGLSVDNKNYSYLHQNKSLYDLVFNLNYDPWTSHLPLVIDETEYTLPLDMHISLGSDPQNVETWRRELNKYGLDLIPEKRELEILVINNK